MRYSHIENAFNNMISDVVYLKLSYYGLKKDNTVKSYRWYIAF